MAPERNNVVERAGETNSLLAAIVECSADAIVGEALNGKITYWNGAAERLFGFPAYEAIGRPSHFFAPRESIHTEAELHSRITQGQKVDPFDAVRVRKDGSTVEVSIAISPIKDATGRTIGASRIMRDISARKATEREQRRRKQMEETLRESEERFRTLADNIAQLAWMADGKGYIFWYNKRWFEYTGTTLEEMQGWGWQKAHHPNHVGRVVEKIRHAFDMGEYWDDTFPLRSKEGNYRWFLSRAIPIRNAQGEVVRWMGTNTDITERMQTEEALQQLTEVSEHQRRLYDTLLASTPDQIGVFGLDRRFIYVNPALLHTLGRAREQVIGRSCAEAGFEPQQGTSHDQEIADVIATRHPIRGEAVYTGAEGRRIYDYLFVPVLGTAGNVEAVGGSLRDITDQKRIAENLERMVGERTVKLRETIGELEAFSYSIAHDMRAPLRSLQGYAEVLLADHSAELNPDGKEFLERIGTAANRMDRLILDVLNYSRIVRSDLRLERVPLGALLKDIIKTYPMFAPDKADIEVAESLPTVLGNDAMLTQVFSNLLGNAVKFTQPGLKPRIRISSEFRGPYARVLVQDNGIGIAADQYQKIFEVFQQADTRYGGTGIGLAIVKKTIERIGGQVGVWSEPGKGSTFWVEIPRAD